MPSSTTVTTATLSPHEEPPFRRRIPSSLQVTSTRRLLPLPSPAAGVTVGVTLSDSSASRSAALSGTMPYARFAACLLPAVADCTTESVTSTPGIHVFVTGCSITSLVAFVSGNTCE